MCRKAIFYLFFFILFNNASAQQHYSVHQQQKDYYDSYSYTTAQEYDQLNDFHLLPQSPNKSSCNLKKIVFGWHPYWIGSAYLNYQWEYLSDLSFFSYEVDAATGDAVTTHGWETAAVVDSAQANGTRVNLCVTLFSNHSTFFASSTAQQTLITNLISLVQLRNANGVNIDFEGVSSSQSANLTSFMIDLSTQMHTAISGSQVSICLYSVDWSNLFNVAAMDAYVDYFTIMGYGYYYSGSSVAGPTAQLYTMSTFDYNLSRTLTYYINAGASKEKLVLGLPYYGQEWNTTSNTVPSNTTSFVSSRTYTYVKTNSSGNYSNRQWEANSFTPYYVYNSGNWRQCFVDDEISLGYKYDMVNRRDIAGIGIWALGYDNGYTELWDLIGEKFTDCAVVPCSDTIYDMGGPAHDHYDNEYYYYAIAPTNATNLSLSFNSFLLESGYDSLWIYDGQDTSSSLIGGYSGTTSPGIIHSTGNALCLEFYSDGATNESGWEAVWQCSIDTIIPTTNITASGWKTDDFKAYFTDNDNNSIDKQFYQVLDFDGNEWRANTDSGFVNDNFESSIHAEWTDIAGTWSIASNHLSQTDETSSNTNIYINIKQDSSFMYLYHWKMNIDGSGTNRRAGLHFFCDSANQSNRHNSYMVYFRVDQDKCQIYRYDNNIYDLKTDVNCTVDPNIWYDCKVIFNTISGEIDVFLDDILIASWKDTNPYQSANAISLRTGNCLVLYDDVKVYKSRTDSVNISLDAIHGDIRYQNPNPTTASARIKSIVTDEVNNISNIASIDINVDWTPPESIITLNDGLAVDIDTTNVGTELSSNWTNSTDTNSALMYYKYAIGTAVGDSNIVVWTQNGISNNFTHLGLSLITNTKYYISVLAKNNAGLYSDTIISDGVLYIDYNTLINNVSTGKFIAYPNPVKETLFFTKIISYSLFDIRGKLLAKGKADNIDMKDFSCGIYLLKTDDILMRIVKE